MNEKTSQSLLVRMGTEDPAAWQRFVHLYSPLVYSWCRKAGLQSQDAGDVSSEIFQTVVEKIKDFKPGSFRGWLRVIARNKIADLYRKQKDPPAVGGSIHKAQMESVESDSSFEIDSDQLAIAKETTFLYQQAVELIKDEFPNHYWAVFDMYVLQELPVDVVMKECNVSRDSVYQIKTRVKKKLSDEFSELIDC